MRQIIIPINIPRYIIRNIDTSHARTFSPFASEGADELRPRVGETQPFPILRGPLPSGLELITRLGPFEIQSPIGSGGPGFARTMTPRPGEPATITSAARRSLAR